MSRNPGVTGGQILISRFGRRCASDAHLAIDNRKTLWNCGDFAMRSIRESS